MNYKIQPSYRTVIFEDTSCNSRFLIKSSVSTKDTATWEDDGKEYPLVRIDVSSASHPVYTGEKRATTSEGRVAKFNRRFGMKLSSK